MTMMQNLASMMPTLQAMTNTWKQEAGGVAGFNKSTMEEEAIRKAQFLASAPLAPQQPVVQGGFVSSSGAAGSPGGVSNNDAGGSGAGTGSPGGGQEETPDEEEYAQKKSGKKERAKPY